MNDPLASFADTPRERTKIVEILMREGQLTNAAATHLVASLYRHGFKVVPIIDRLQQAISEHGQIPHMTQRP